MELPIAQKPRSKSPLVASRTSHDGAHPAPQSPQRPRRFSFISDYRPSFLQASPDDGREEFKEHAADRPVSQALAAVEKARSYLSTSPDVSFGPPGILAKLASREKSEQHRRLGGDDKAALNSLLGWDSKRLRQQGSAGTMELVNTAGFVRHQSFSVLYSEYVSQTQPVSRPSTPSTSSPAPPESEPRMILCGKRRRWVTFRYYCHDQADECLGEAIVRLCSHADDPCDNPDCRSKRGDHELRFIHAGIRITLLIEGEAAPVSPEDEEELPEMWVSCRACKKESSKVHMRDGT